MEIEPLAIHADAVVIALRQEHLHGEAAYIATEFVILELDRAAGPFEIDFRQLIAVALAREDDLRLCEAGDHADLETNAGRIDRQIGEPVAGHWYFHLLVSVAHLKGAGAIVETEVKDKKNEKANHSRHDKKQLKRTCLLE